MNSWLLTAALSQEAAGESPEVMQTTPQRCIREVHYGSVSGECDIHLWVIFAGTLAERLWPLDTHALSSRVLSQILDVVKPLHGR